MYEGLKNALILSLFHIILMVSPVFMILKPLDPIHSKCKLSVTYRSKAPQVFCILHTLRSKLKFLVISNYEC